MNMLKVLKILLKREPSDFERRINFDAWKDNPEIFNKILRELETKVNVAQISANATLSASQDAAAEKATRQ